VLGARMSTVEQSLNQLQGDLAQAMKAKDKVRVASLRHMRTALQKLVTSGADNVSQGDVIGAYRTLVKQRRDAAEAYQAAGRTELADQERAEQAVIEEYLPQAPSEDQIRVATQAVVTDMRANGTEPNMGAVMKAVMSQFGSTVDGKTVSNVVRSVLA